MSPRLSSQAKVLAVYPRAEVYHQPLLGRAYYAVFVDRENLRRRIIGEGWTASKAWVNGAKNIAEGKEPYLCG